MKCLLTTAILSVSLPLSAFAEEKPTPPPGPGRDRMLDRAFQALDANEDGQVDPAEFRAHMPKLVERVRGEFRKRFDRLPMRARLERLIDQRIRLAVDRLRDSHRRGPHHGPGRAFGARPPHAGPHAFRPGPDERFSRPRWGGKGFGVHPPVGRPPAFQPDPDERTRRPGHARGGEGRFGPHANRRRPPTPQRVLMTLFDANRDGNIDRTEVDRAADALKNLDHDKDGTITAPEIAEAAAKHGKGPGQSGKHRP